MAASGRAAGMAGLVLLAAVSAPVAAGDEPYFFVDGFAVQHKERVPERQIAFGGRAGAGTVLTEDGDVALELGLFGNPIQRKSGGDGSQVGLMLDMVDYLGGKTVRPYLFLGAGGVREHLLFSEGTHFAAEFGAGAKWALSDTLALRGGVSLQDVFNGDYYTKLNALLDTRVNVGLVWTPEARQAASPPPAPRIIDSDGDGVPDSQDRCPNVPAATADGCPPPAPVEPPKDSDGDGVIDSQDACPGTLAGMKVDERGCAIEAAQSIVLKGLAFVPNSAELTPEASTVLDKAATALMGQPSLKVEVGGHTDPSGNAKKNVALSQARADAVRKYLVGKGVDASRLTARGYGSSQPVADNKTKEGRAENRRVELKIVQ